MSMQSMQMMGNSRARAVYEASLPDDYRRPQNDQAVEAFIRQKYEKKKYIASEWSPSKPPEYPIGWDEAGTAGAADKKPEFKKLTVPATAQQKLTASSSPGPAANNVSKSPKPAAVTKPTVTASSNMVKSSSTLDTDLLGLSLSSSSTPSSASSSAASVPSSASAQDLLGLNSEFSGFVSASPAATQQQSTGVSNSIPTTAATAAADNIDSGKMSKDSIMALFGPKTTPAPMTNFSSPNNQFGGLQQLGGMQQQSLGGMQQPQLQQQQFGGSMQQQQQQGMFGQIQQQPSMFPQQHHQSPGGAFAGLGQLGGQAFNQPPMQPSNPQNSKNSDH